MDAKDLVERSVQELFRRDADLPDTVNERTLTHRLAIYIENELPSLDGWHRHLSVDCEYNRRFTNDPKSLIGIPEYGEVSAWDTEAKTVYPDIIVHQRGIDDDNRIIIELKVAERSSTETRERDRQKLCLYREQLHYQRALFVLLHMAAKRCDIEVIGPDTIQADRPTDQPSNELTRDDQAACVRSGDRHPRVLVDVNVQRDEHRYARVNSVPTDRSAVRFPAA